MSSKRRLSKYLDALAAGRRPGKLSATPEDVGLLRTAVALRSSRPDVPDPSFISGLHRELTDIAASHGAKEVVPIDRPRVQRGRAAVISIAAGVALVGGSVAVTEALQPGSLAPAAIEAPHGGDLHTGSFETIGNRVMGQIVAYSGSPSWVFMTVDIPNYDGRVICTLQAKSGSTIAAGYFQLHDGMGAWSKTIPVSASGLRGAKLTTSSGAVVAAATLA
jgi:hypothetical protein